MTNLFYNAPTPEQLEEQEAMVRKRLVRQVRDIDLIDASGPHPSHKTRPSDASSFDEICEACGATDQLGSWGMLRDPCPGKRGS